MTINQVADSVAKEDKKYDNIQRNKKTNNVITDFYCASGHNNYDYIFPSRT